MSHYSTIATQIRDEDCLVQALADLGYTDVERGPAIPLIGFWGRQSGEVASVVIRREHIAGQFNDVGFRRMADGTYQAIVTDMDQRGGFRWPTQQKPLMHRYAYHTTVKQAAAQGFSVVAEVKEPNGSTRLVFRPHAAAAVARMRGTQR